MSQIVGHFILYLLIQLDLTIIVIYIIMYSHSVHFEIRPVLTRIKPSFLCLLLACYLLGFVLIYTLFRYENLFFTHFVLCCTDTASVVVAEINDCFSKSLFLYYTGTRTQNFLVAYYAINTNMTLNVRLYGE